MISQTVVFSFIWHLYEVANASILTLSSSADLFDQMSAQMSAKLKAIQEL